MDFSLKMVFTFGVILGLMAIIANLSQIYKIQEPEWFKLVGGIIVAVCGLGILGLGLTWILINIWN
jgi:hypothetical protein